MGRPAGAGDNHPGRGLAVPTVECSLAHCSLAEVGGHHPLGGGGACHFVSVQGFIKLVAVGVGQGQMMQGTSSNLPPAYSERRFSINIIARKLGWGAKEGDVMVRRKKATRGEIGQGDMPEPREGARHVTIFQAKGVTALMISTIALE